MQNMAIIVRKLFTKYTRHKAV